MADYRVIQVSQQPPRVWEGPHGAVYYILVKLEGHSRPVSVGKKKPDALKAGDVISGDIIDDPSHDEDKFKAAPMAQGNFGGGGFSQPATSAGSVAQSKYQPSDERQSEIKAEWAIGLAVRLLKIEGGKVPSNQAIELWADTFFEMVNRVKEGKRPMDAPKTVVPEPFDDNDAEAVSLYQNIAQDEISAEDIPF